MLKHYTHLLSPSFVTVQSKCIPSLRRSSGDVQRSFRRVVVVVVVVMLVMMAMSWLSCGQKE